MDRRIDLTLNSDFADSNENRSRFMERSVRRVSQENIGSIFDEKEELMLTDFEKDTDFFVGTIDEIKQKQKRNNLYKEIDDVENGLRCERCGASKLFHRDNTTLCDSCEDLLDQEFKHQMEW